MTESRWRLGVLRNFTLFCVAWTSAHPPPSTYDQILDDLYPWFLHISNNIRWTVDAIEWNVCLTYFSVFLTYFSSNWPHHTTNQSWTILYNSVLSNLPFKGGRPQSIQLTEWRKDVLALWTNVQSLGICFPQARKARVTNFLAYSHKKKISDSISSICSQHTYSSAQIYRKSL